MIAPRWLPWRGTVNPYRRMALIAASRLRWDLQPEAWRSRAKLARWRNAHATRRCVIVCNGPSLLQTNLTLATSAFTFGLNKINLLFHRNPFRPSCIVAVNPYVIEQNAEFYRSTDIPLFLDSGAIEHVPSRSNIVYLHCFAEGFAKDCSMSVNQGGTVTYVALQLAFHMGFSAVALVGCDHNFVSVGKPNEVAVAGATDPNHFDPKYFADGARWQYPNLHESEASYHRARKTFESDGRRVFNATVGGKLEVFPRIALDEFLTAPASLVPGLPIS